MKLRPPIKIHGGKWYLNGWIISHFPENYEQYDFVEPYVGGGSVFLNKIPSKGVEVINDINPDIISIFHALRDEPTTFIGRLKKIKYCESSYKRMERKQPSDYIDQAVKEFALRRMSRGGLKTAFAWSDRERGGQPGDVNAWETIIRQLPAIAERLENTYILNKPALEIIKAFDDENILLYIDPPYLPETRVTPEAYEHEMDIDDHTDLADCLNRFKGKVVISGYASQLYKRLYKGWKCYKKKIANHASQQKKKAYKLEHIWTNY